MPAEEIRRLLASSSNNLEKITRLNQNTKVSTLYLQKRKMVMHKLMQTMIHHLEEGEDVVLATVIDSSGSTPRSTGSQMVVRANGTISGTIGGGLVEAEAM
ncbi:MAG TPA: XdhC family protein, partial [Thermodesulfobacteriota bacterium]|nr:XdhC family protein [Thermodesulfobacteriota bacterium]